MPEHADPASERHVVALRCTIGRTAVAVARDAIDGVVELDLALPPPLASRLVAGLAVHDGELVIVLGLAPVAPSRRVASAVLMSGRRAGARWAVEVNAIGSFARVTPTREERGGPATTRRDPWLERGLADDGKEVRLLDFDRLIAEAMGGTAVAELS